MLKSFLTGAAGYPLLEILYRGRTHYSMALAGGAGLCLIRLISRLRLPVLMKALLCGSGITAIELLCGLIWNKDHRVWDYRRLPLNFRGQICLPYTLLWCGMSACLLLAERHAKRLARP